MLTCGSGGKKEKKRQREREESKEGGGVVVSIGIATSRILRCQARSQVTRTFFLYVGFLGKKIDERYLRSEGRYLGVRIKSFEKISN